MSGMRISSLITQWEMSGSAACRPAREEELSRGIRLGGHVLPAAHHLAVGCSESNATFRCAGPRKAALSR